MDLELLSAVLILQYNYKFYFVVKTRLLFCFQFCSL